VVLGVLRAALRPSWTLADASRAVLVDVDDPVILRGAMARLRSSAEGRTTLFQARALATPELAITLLDRHDELAEPGVGVRRNGGSSR
jgi:hypothetical protein